MEYISSTKSAGEKRCFLCVDPNEDDESLVVGRKGAAFVIMNRFPYTNGHVMVVPVRHTGLVEGLSDEELLGYDAPCEDHDCHIQGRIQG